MAHIRRHCDRSKGSRQQGQSLIEFALVMPLLIALLAAIMLFAWIGFSYLSISSAARHGARYMLTSSDLSNDGIKAEVCDSMPFLACPDPGVITTTISPEDEDLRKPPTVVVVHITYKVKLPTIRVPYFFREGEFYLLPPIVLNAESRMNMFE